MVPESAILQPCGARYDSPKPAQTLTVTVSVAGTLQAVNSATGLTSTVTFAATTRTKAFARIPFLPRAYYLGGAVPEPGEFYLVTDCCCTKCRFKLIFGTIDWSDFAFPWTRAWSGESPPDDDDGSDAPGISISDGYRDVSASPEDTEIYASQRAAGREIFCHRADEDGRRGQWLNVFVTALSTDPGNGFILPPLDWSYTDSAGAARTGTGYTSGLNFSGPATVEDGAVEADTCEDSQSVDAQIIYSGSAVSGAVTSSVTAFTIGMTFDLS